MMDVTRECNSYMLCRCFLIKPSIFKFDVQLLEMLMNNIGENIHKQVVDTGILPILVKMVKKKVCTHMLTFVGY